MDGERRRVLIVGPSLRYLGGQAVQAKRLLEGLASDPTLDVEYLVVDPTLPGPLAALQKIAIVRTIVTSLWYVASLLRQVPRADTVHAFSASFWSFLLAPVPAMLVGRLFGKYVILNYHSGEADDHLTRWGWHARPLMRLAQLVLVPTQFLVEVFAKHGLSAVAIANHLDTSRMVQRPRTSIAPQFFANRNFEDHYGVHHILDAFQIVQRRYPEASLVLAGNGSLRPALEAQAVSLCLRNLSFTGPVAPSDMPALYAAADVYVNASVVDNMPLSLLEAYASSLPVITSDAGGIPWIAANGVTATVVPTRNASALAAGMLDALEHPEAALARAAAARKYVEEQFTWPRVALKWRQAFMGQPVI